MSPIPLMIDLTGRRTVIVGGGSVAEKRVKVLCEAGAFITIISPFVTSSLEEKLTSNKRIKWIKKEFDEADLKDAYTVVIATNDEKVNEQALRSAAHVPLINYPPDANRGNFTIPGYLTRGKLTISISTGGASPILASRIRKRLENEFDDDYGQYVDFLYVCRKELKKSSLPKEKKQTLMKHLLHDSYKNRDQQTLFLKELEKLKKGERVFEGIN
ncbi:NAD(P)-binding protein [Halobacillus mangrovi]|uniref:NAD(P)-binding protein n=1 Tax=Halobacillus mangrovi TaxID=402384 RepID=UPI003D97C4F1